MGKMRTRRCGSTPRSPKPVGIAPHGGAVDDVFGGLPATAPRPYASASRSRWPRELPEEPHPPYQTPPQAPQAHVAGTHAENLTQTTRYLRVGVALYRVDRKTSLRDLPHLC